MTQVEQLAAFAVRTRYEDLSEEAREQLKIRIIDALDCAIGALEGPPINMLRAQLEDFGGKPLVTLIGGGKTALRVTRTGSLSNWKGLAYPNTAFGATHATFLAMRGITDPLEVFEGNKGLMDAITGPFELDWTRENLEAVPHTSAKKYNAEFHSQSAL